MTSRLRRPDGGGAGGACGQDERPHALADFGVVAARFDGATTCMVPLHQSLTSEKAVSLSRDELKCTRPAGISEAASLENVALTDALRIELGP